MADAWVSGGACGRGAAHTWFPTGTAVTAGVVPVTTGGTAGGAAEFELVTAGVVPVTMGGTAGGAAEFELGRFPMLLAVWLCVLHPRNLEDPNLEGSK